MTDTTYGDSNIQGTSARAINLCIGAGALLLGPGLVLVGWVSSYFLLTHPGWLTAPSISEYYYFNELTRNGFVGTMCAVGLLMSAYRGWHQRNLWDRVIAVWSLIFAWLVGLVPCNSALSVVHFSAAGLLFGLMAAMLWFRFTDFTRDAAEDRDRAWKEVRNRIYKSCACVIIAAIGVKALSMTGLVGLDTISSGNLTFWVEVTGLSAFSFGWLTKSRYILGYQATDGWFSRSWRTAAN